MEHYEVAKSFSGDFTTSEFKERYLERFPERNPGSILPSDFSHNNEQRAKERFPSFLQTVAPSVYRFVDFDEGKQKGRRNPPWSRDELILALDLYFRHRRRLPDKNHPEVVELSNILNRLFGDKAQDAALFRNPNGVYMKLANFRRLDPEYTADGKTGLSRGGKGDEETWDDFADRQEELQAAAAAIRAAVGSIEARSDQGQEIEYEASEGRILAGLHLYRERDQKIVSRKKRDVLAKVGRLECETCGFDFDRTYGDRGKGFAEVHHIKPVSKLRPGEKTKFSDLAILCANCHRMIHATKDWLSLDELRTILSRQRR